MATQVAMPGGWELILIVVVPATMMAVLLIGVYGVVRLATRGQRVDPDVSASRGKASEHAPRH